MPEHRQRRRLPAAPDRRAGATDSPARNSTKKPALAISSAVPRSGCLAISSTGTTISAPATSSCSRRGGSRLSDRYQATIIGTASFMISEGWKRTTPRSSQRCAPLPMSPTTSTASSNSTPRPYSQGVQRCSQAAGTAPPAIMAPKAMPRRIIWRIRPSMLLAAGAVQHDQAEDARRRAGRPAAAASMCSDMLPAALAGVFTAAGRVSMLMRRCSEQIVRPGSCGRWVPPRAAAAAVLDHHRDGDPRLFDRREGDEQGVIAQLLSSTFSASYSSSCLRPNTCAVPVLPAMLVAGRWPMLARRAALAVHHVVIASMTACPVLAFHDRQWRHGFDWPAGSSSASSSACVARTMCGLHVPAELASVAVALASCSGVVSMKPWPMPVISVSPGNQGWFAGAAFPFPRRQQAGQFAGDIDAGARAEAEMAEKFVQPVDAHRQRQIVEIDVAGLGDGACAGRPCHGRRVSSHDICGPCRAAGSSPGSRCWRCHAGDARLQARRGRRRA